MELDASTACLLFGDGSYNLLRRGADGSLTLSADKWRVSGVTDLGVGWDPVAPEGQAIRLAMDEIQHISWDRLPKQLVRSQVRFALRNGDLWTFSGSFDETVIAELMSRGR